MCRITKFQTPFRNFSHFHPIFILAQAPTTPLSEARQRQRQQGVVVWVDNTSLVGQELIDRDLAVTLSSTRMLTPLSQGSPLSLELVGSVRHGVDMKQCLCHAHNAKANLWYKSIITIFAKCHFWSCSPIFFIKMHLQQRNRRRAWRPWCPLTSHAF